MNKLDKTCYAYPDKELYPVHTKQAALKSYHEFVSDAKYYSPQRVNLIADNFIKAASVHDIKYPRYEQTPRQTVSFLTDSGARITLSKIASVKDLQDTLNALQQARAEMPIKQLRKVAQYAVVQAQQQDIESQSLDKLAMLAGFGVGQPEQILTEFRKRGSLINLPYKVNSAFYSAYRNLQQLSNVDQDGFYKKASQLCDIMDDIDRNYSLMQKYDKQLKKPEQVCFSLNMTKLANQAQDYLHVPSTSTILSKKALLQSKQQVSDFLQTFYGVKPQTDDQLLNKVAGLSSIGIKALIKAVE